MSECWSLARSWTDAVCNSTVTSFYTWNARYKREIAPICFPDGTRLGVPRLLSRKTKGLLFSPRRRDR
jgi:hypothetical protein